MVGLRSLPLTIIAVIATIAIFLVFTSISIYMFPVSWSPRVTFLSDFGNTVLSPKGSWFFNLGCKLTGISIISFYLSLMVWWSGDRWRFLMMFSQLIGVASGISLVLIGIYPEDFPAEHRFWSYAFFIINFFAIFLVNTSLVTHERYSKFIAAFVYLVLAVILGGFYLYGGIPLVEWFAVGSSMIFASLLALETWWLID
jgi:hypothetical membrane protein